MIKGLYNASRSMHNKIQNIQIVANNLANINTSGFKRGVPFSEYISKITNQPVKQITDFSQGTLEETSNPFDLAISGKAFFEIKTSRGIEITRNGQFTIDDEGYLSTKDGFRVLGTDGEINLDETFLQKNSGITISKNGEIKSGDFIIAQLKIVKLEDQNNLIRTEGQRFYDSLEMYSPVVEGEFSIHQGYLETANSNPILEMQSMIQLEKDFEASQKMIASLDDMLSHTKELGKL